MIRVVVAADDCSSVVGESNSQVGLILVTIIPSFGNWPPGRRGNDGGRGGNEIVVQRVRQLSDYVCLGMAIDQGPKVQRSKDPKVMSHRRKVETQQH